MIRTIYGTIGQKEKSNETYQPTACFSALDILNAEKIRQNELMIDLDDLCFEIREVIPELKAVTIMSDDNASDIVDYLLHTKREPKKITDFRLPMKNDILSLRVQNGVLTVNPDIIFTDTRVNLIKKTPYLERVTDKIITEGLNKNYRFRSISGEYEVNLINKGFWITLPFVSRYSESGMVLAYDYRDQADDNNKKLISTSCGKFFLGGPSYIKSEFDKNDKMISFLENIQVEEHKVPSPLKEEIIKVKMLKDR